MGRGLRPFDDINSGNGQQKRSECMRKIGRKAEFLSLFPAHLPNNCHRLHRESNSISIIFAVLGVHEPRHYHLLVMARLTSDNSSPNPSLPLSTLHAAASPKYKFILEILGLAKKVKIYAPNHSPCPALKCYIAMYKPCFISSYTFCISQRAAGVWKLRVAKLPLSSAETESDSSSR
jgi:hypothetical protein